MVVGDPLTHREGKGYRRTQSTYSVLGMAYCVLLRLYGALRRELALFPSCVWETGSEKSRDHVPGPVMGADNRHQHRGQEGRVYPQLGIGGGGCYGLGAHASGAAHLHRVEDGLQSGQHVAEEEVPRLCQRVQQLLACGHREPSLPIPNPLSRHFPPSRVRSSLSGPREVPGLRAGVWALEVPPSPLLSFSCLSVPINKRRQ